MAKLTRADVIHLLPPAGTPANFNHRSFETGIDLTGLDLCGVSLVGANLPDANLAGMDLSGANFRGARLNGANLNGAKLQSVNFGKNYLSGLEAYVALYYFLIVVGIIVGVLPGILILVLIQLRRRGAILTSASLSGVDLRYANLKGSDLSSVNFSQANLSRADLRYANLSGANLSGANFEGTKIGGAKIPDIYIQPKSPVASLAQQVVGYSGSPIGQPRNTMAIAGFVLGIIGVLTSWFLLGALFCIPGIIVSAKSLRRTGDRKKAITGLVLSIIGIAIAVTILIVAFTSIK